MSFLRLFFLATALSAGASIAQQDEPFTTLEEEQTGGTLSQFHMVKASLTKEQGKVDSAFWHDLGYDVAKGSAETRRRRRVSRRSEGGEGGAEGEEEEEEETVEVVVKANVTDALLDFVQSSLRGHVSFSSAEFGSVTVELPAPSLQALAEHEDVIRITPPEPFTAHKLTTTQGVGSHRVPLARTSFAAATGRGVKVGVLSDSSSYLAQVQASGDLPAGVTVLQAGTGKGEGTAMMEIVHDMAPGAELFFATAGSSQAQFAANIIALANRGCRVIVDDILFFGEPAYEDGPVARAVDQVAARGVAFFSSAGNFGSTFYNTGKVYEGNYRGAPLTLSNLPGRFLDTHLFATNRPYATVSATSLTVTLHWADPMYSPATDYDLIVTDANGVIKAFSANGGQAYEYLTYRCATYSALRIYVVRYSGPARLFSLRVYGGGSLSPATEGQIYGHTAARGAFSIAAIPRLTSGSYFDSLKAGASLRLQSFSSQGKRRIFFQDGAAVTPGVFTSSGGVVRNKPDFTAADGALTSTPGFATFYGTSAAAPHAAALAALALSVRPTLTLPQLTQAMRASAMDVLTPGWDTVSGYGILDAAKLLQAATGTAGSTAPTTAPTQAPTKAPTTAPTTARCPTGFYGRATWQSTLSGMYATGVCEDGWEGAPRRRCNAGGVWDDNLTNHCQRSTTTTAATQAPTNAPTTAPATARCPTGFYGRATWPATAAGQYATGVCESGWEGAPRRRCLAGGVWDGNLSFHCQRSTTTTTTATQAPTQAPAPAPTTARCPTGFYGRATWPATAVGQYATGVCEDGWEGAPRRRCLAGGVWDGNLTNHCQRSSASTSTPTCPPRLYANAEWPSTAAGGTATGRCVEGWRGSPRRICKQDGTWQDLVTSHCQRV